MRRKCAPHLLETDSSALRGQETQEFHPDRGEVAGSGPKLVGTFEAAPSAYSSKLCLVNDVLLPTSLALAPHLVNIPLPGDQVGPIFLWGSETMQN